MSYLPFLRPLLVETDEIIPYLRRIDATRLYSNFGPLTLELEQRILSEYFGCAGLVSTVHNATAGLMLAIDAVRRPAGRYAIMPSFTFAAAPQAALWCGLEPYFVDIRAGDFCLDVQAVERAVEELGDALAVIVPYAAFGTVCDLDFYAQLQRGGRPVVVDAAASFGSSLNGHQFGAAFPGAVVFSFHATKSFGIGEGGMVYSSDEDLIARIRRASNFGFSATRVSEFRGLNAKLSEYAAAVALATLDCYPAKAATRNRLYEAYVDSLTRHRLFEVGWELQEIDGDVAHQFMPVLCPRRFVNQAVVERLEQAGIQTRTYFSPACHEQPAFSGSPRTLLEVTETVSRRILNLPLWEDMQLRDVERVVQSIAAL